MMIRRTFNLQRATYNAQRGFALVESIIAVSIATIGILSLVALLNRSLAIQRLVTERYIAAHLASEGIELIKNVLSANVIAGVAWNEGFPTTITDVEMDYNDTFFSPMELRPLLFNGIWYGYDAGVQSPFVRNITIEPMSSPIEEFRVRSVVRWNSRGIDQVVDLEDHVMNWRCTPGAPGCS